MAHKRRIAIIGVSRDRSKFGNRAVRAYKAEGWQVYPVHPTAESIEGLPAYPNIETIPGTVERASLYLPPEIGLTVLDGIAAKGVTDLYLNPGSESTEIIAKAQELGVRPILACSIVEIGRSPVNPDRQGPT